MKKYRENIASAARHADRMVELIDCAHRDGAGETRERFERLLQPASDLRGELRSILASLKSGKEEQ